MPKLMAGVSRLQLVTDIVGGSCIVLLMMKSAGVALFAGSVCGVHQRVRGIMRERFDKSLITAGHGRKQKVAGRAEHGIPVHTTLPIGRR